MSLNTLKWTAIVCFVVSMAVLLGGGVQMSDSLPPYPGTVVGPDGNTLFQKADIFAGQGVYQRYGLMDHGAVWGHGSQRGSEFSATTLHIMAEAVGDYLSEKEYGKSYQDLDNLRKEIIDVRTKNEIKTNRYDDAQDILKLTPAQLQALEKVHQHWDKTFKEGEQRYGFLPDTIKDDQQRLQVSRFFFWTAWVASTLRPGEDYTYTNNWPPDRRVGSTGTFYLLGS
ncbi:MAG: hypothetical protein JRH15_05400 [Deltaproteobacteria bacterium]|nr:hypothetical protein [Deltaproteobacteria bacterium]